MWEPAGLMATVCVFHLSEKEILFLGLLELLPAAALQYAKMTEWTVCEVCVLLSHSKSFFRLSMFFENLKGQNFNIT